jgi:hypothetical protein
MTIHIPSTGFFPEIFWENERFRKIAGAGKSGVAQGAMGGSESG